MAASPLIDLAILVLLAPDSETIFGDLVAASLRSFTAQDAGTHGLVQGAPAHEQLKKAHDRAFLLWLDLPRPAQVEDLQRYTSYIGSRLSCFITAPQALPPGILPSSAAPQQRAIFLFDLVLAIEMIERNPVFRRRSFDRATEHARSPRLRLTGRI